MAWSIPDLVQVTESDAVDAVEAALEHYSADVLFFFCIFVHEPYALANH